MLCNALRKYIQTFCSDFYFLGNKIVRYHQIIRFARLDDDIKRFHARNLYFYGRYKRSIHLTGLLENLPSFHMECKYVGVILL